MREALLVLLAACGRVGFDARVGGDASADVPRDVGATGDVTDATNAISWSGLVAYADQTCAIHAGLAYCWGQIGTAAGNVTAPTPQSYAVTGAVTAIAPGEQFTCTAAAEIDCFGAQPGGLVAAALSTPVTSFSGGRNFACYVDQGVRCWGANDVGQLGLGDMTTRSSPVALALSPSYTEVRAGDDHACAFGSSGTAMCWGHNDNGTMGTGSTSPSAQLTPQAVLVVSALPLIAGWHACALDQGTVYCWGRDTEGELGDGGSTSLSAPTAILNNATVLATGGGPTDHDASCAVVAGQTKCWGQGTYGRLGQGTASSSNVPVDVVGLPAAPIELAIGYDHACAHLTTDEIYCWGRGDLGQLGDGLMTTSMTPVKVALP